MDAEIDYELKAIAEEHRADFTQEFFRYRDFVEESLEAENWPELRFRLGQETSRDSKLVKAILSELRALLCTEDKRYSDVRRSAGVFSKVALPAVAAYVAGAVGISVGLASGGVAFIALAVFKVGKNVFCKTTKPST
jgi:hypothetical protein